MITRRIKERSIAEVLLHKAQRGHPVVPPLESGPTEGDEVHLQQSRIAHWGTHSVYLQPWQLVSLLITQGT